MTQINKRHGGFTLIELMIVVAIIGILAAIAIPNFLKFQLRSKTGEAKTNLAAIRTAEEGYFAEYGQLVPAAVSPAGAMGSGKREWTGGGVADFNSLGWSPEGRVFYSYEVAVAGGAFSAGAQGDLDGAPPTSDYAYMHPDAAGVFVAAPLVAGCAADGVFGLDETGAPTTFENTVGPCAQIDGQDEF